MWISSKTNNQDTLLSIFYSKVTWSIFKYITFHLLNFLYMQSILCFTTLNDKQFNQLASSCFVQLVLLSIHLNSNGLCLTEFKKISIFYIEGVQCLVVWCPGIFLEQTVGCLVDYSSNCEISCEICSGMKRNPVL